jgi:hypothetical protein
MNNYHELAKAFYREQEAEAMRQRSKQEEPKKKTEAAKKAEPVATPEPVNNEIRTSLIQRIKNFVKHIKTTIHANR